MCHSLPAVAHTAPLVCWAAVQMRLLLAWDLRGKHTTTTTALPVAVQAVAVVVAVVAVQSQVHARVTCMYSACLTPPFRH